MFALRATMHVAFMTLKEDAFAALTPSDGNTIRWRKRYTIRSRITGVVEG